MTVFSMKIFLELMKIFDIDKYVLKILHFDRIDLREGIDPTKSNIECIVFHD